MNLFDDSLDNRDELTFEFADIMRETNDAWQFEMDTMPNPVWLPKSQCQLSAQNGSRSTFASLSRQRMGGTVTVPEWLAIEKGLV